MRFPWQKKEEFYIEEKPKKQVTIRDFSKKLILKKMRKSEEFGTELAQGFSQIAKGLLCLGLADWQPYVRRLAWDCVPSIRVKLLRSLENNAQTVDQLEQSTGIPQRTIYYHLEHLELLKVVKDNNGVKEIAIPLP